MSPPVTNYGHADDVFASAVPPSMVEQEAATSIQQENDGGLQAFYPVAHTSPHGPRMSLPQRRPPDPPNAPYVTGPPQTDQQALSSAGLGMHPFLPVTVTLESSLPEIEIKQSRPKPQCWDHGCNGRQFKRKEWERDEGGMPTLWHGIHTDDSAEWAYDGWQV
ncbi:hypothetical protein A1O3_02429 [Capronia epimyces CBS 606.96]|uniref:Uncharacterized protein n=1 Tax=Capronia epimyces CBS 606.96 TaxID=1182542 RepID=W9Y969_9EURO|nr:uncharacterized protein A1O3_02429 [Capronia epimyces CBS 606.96]EXJ89362.1 hypothetical protein A1O3_02429 [Capronia epimyces CBS 606.96]